MRLFIFFLLVFLFSKNSFSQCGLNEELFVLKINTDSNPDNMYWSINDHSNEVVNFGFQLNTIDTFEESFCLKQGDYSFNIKQTGSSAWSGTYSLTNSTNQSVASGSANSSIPPAMFWALGIHPCQTINGSVSHSLPPDNMFTDVPNGDTITVCYGINLQSLLNFPENNTDYNQSVTNVSYLWEVINPAGASNGQTSDASTAYFTFDDFAVYKIVLTVTDTNDCAWNHEIFVKNTSGNTFIELTVDDPLLCIGETSNIHASYTNVSFVPEVIEPDPIFLDDVLGGQYESTINISHFPDGDTLTPNCIERVCASMEHTFAGDLSIFLIVPSGDTVDFVPDLNGPADGNGFGGIDMGIPNTVNTTLPGTPYLYCWTPTAPITMHDYTAGSPASVFPETIINADGTFTNDYAVNADNGNGWDNATGSSINGDWSFSIIDNWLADDGFIFGWSFELCVDSEVQYVDSSWTGPTGSFTSTIDQDSLTREIVGVATANSIMTFEYRMTDNFGCEWVQEIDVRTEPLPIINPGTTVQCNDTYNLGVIDMASTLGSWTYVPPVGVTDPVVFTPSVNDLTPSVTVPDIGVYDFIYTNECGLEFTQTIFFESMAPIPEIGVEETVECDNEYQLLAIDTSGTIGTWTYLGPPGSVGTVIFSPSATALTPDITVPVLGTYDFTYLSTCGLGGVQTVHFVSKAPELDVEIEKICDFSIDLVANNPANDGVWSFTSPSGETAAIDDVNAATTSATVTSYGTYTFTFTYEFCDASFSQTVDFTSVKPEIVSNKTMFTCESEIELAAEVEGQVVGWKVLSGPGIVNFSAFDQKTSMAEFSEYGTYEIQFEGCGGFDTVQVVFEKEAPSLHIPSFVQCGLQVLIEVDFKGVDGIWSIVAENDEIITYTEQNDKQIILTSDRYGSAVVRYEACDTFSQSTVVFMCELDVPNVFTPNNDAYNSEFYIPRLSSTFYSKSKFTVFNRWGVVVYSNGEYGLKGSFWNGRTNNSGEDVPEGTYFYELNLHNKVNDLDENYKGSINLFR